METEKLVSILLVLFVFAFLVISIFYVLGSPLKERLTNLKCYYLDFPDCKKIPEISKEEQMKIKAANEKNLLNAISYTYENCGKDKKISCKCTLSFSMFDSVLILLEKENKVFALTSADNQKEININKLLLDDPFTAGHKPIDIKKLIIEKREVQGISTLVSSKDYEIKIEYENKIKSYGGPNQDYIDSVLDSFGILKDEQGNKILYIPEGLADIEPFPVHSFEDKTAIPNC